MSKKLVLYCYYEKDDVYKDNLRYFIKKGIREENDYIFIINGECSVEIPNKKNIIVKKRTNTGFDFGGYSEIILDSNNSNILDYDYYIFMNTSIRGPFLPSYIEDNDWTYPFIKLIKNNVKLVGVSINILNNITDETLVFSSMYNYNMPYTHVQSYFFVMDKDCINFLLSKNFFSLTMEDNFHKVIANEILMSQLILANNWNISCVIPEYQNHDYRLIKHDINYTSINGDPIFPNACFGRSLHPYETIFIKTNRFFYLNEISSLSNHIFNS